MFSNRATSFTSGVPSVIVIGVRWKYRLSTIISAMGVKSVALSISLKSFSKVSSVVTPS